jgi:hypothetical protein
MTAYQPEQWHDRFVAMAGAAAALGMPVCGRRSAESVGCPAEWKGRDARPSDGRGSVTCDWFRTGVR